MTEDQLEQEALGWLADVGYQHRYGPDLAADGAAPERSDYRQVLLVERLRQAVATLNPAVPQVAHDDAVKQVMDLGTPVLLAANRQFHRLLVTGVPMQYCGPDCRQHRRCRGGDQLPSCLLSGARQPAQPGWLTSSRTRVSTTGACRRCGRMPTGRAGPPSSWTAWRPPPPMPSAA